VWELANGGLDKLRTVHFYLGRFEEALIDNAEYLSLSEEHGFNWGVVKYKVSQGLLYLHLGRYPEAQKLGEQAVLEAQNEAFLCEALILLTQIHIALGSLDAAGRYLKEGMTLCPTRLVGTGLYVAGNGLYQGLLAAGQGKHASAWAYLQTELEAAVARKATLALSNIIAVAAYIKTIQGEVVSAMELFALAQQNSFVANSIWYEDVVGQKIALAAQRLAPETVRAARLRGKELDLWETAALLTEQSASS
jgi:tetratricopeptide (TPR) repeat protein